MNVSRLLHSTAVLLVLALATSGHVLAGDPVPGVDISIEQIPGGIVKTVKTDKDGKFTFANLKPGNYVLKLVPTKAENHNSSRSNKTYPLSPKGSTDCVVTISLITTGKKQPFEPVEVTIGPKGGRISGRVVLGVGIKEEGVK